MGKNNLYKARQVQLCTGSWQKKKSCRGGKFLASFSFLVDSLTPRFTLRRQLGAHVGFSAFFFACSFVAFPLLLSKLVPFLSCGCSQNMCMSDVSATEDNFGGRQPKGREGVSLRVQAGKERGWSKAGGGAPRGRGEEPKSSPSLQAYAEFHTLLHLTSKPVWAN